MFGVRSKWVLAFLFVAFVMLGCGKNDPFVPAGYVGGPYQAPAPVGNPYYNPNGYNPSGYPNYYPYPGGYNQYPNQYPQYPNYYYPNPGTYAPYYQPSGGYPTPYFYPQIPTGYPNQYTPFLPIDNYMRRSPYLQGYWGDFWNRWQQHCQLTGRNPYDFSYFWRTYCPQQWRGTQYWDLYQSFNSQFYYWVQSDYYFDVNLDAGSFWYYYTGHPYIDYDTQGYCGGYCDYYY